MSHPSKAKGYRFEVLVVKTAIEQGLPAERAWGSNGASKGWHPEVDIVIAGKKLQAKCRKRMSKVVRPSEHVDGQLIKEDRGTAYVVITLDHYLELLRISYENDLHRHDGRPHEEGKIQT